MKNLLYAVLILSGISLMGCHKNKGDACPEIQITAPEQEVASLQQYIESTNIIATKDKRGFFYTVDKEGSGKHPSACSNVSVGYVGKLTDGKVFDQNDNIAFDLGNLISGWQEGIPLVGEGGVITLYLPPTLGYGDRASGPIPPNSITIFTITLHNVND